MHMSVCGDLNCSKCCHNREIILTKEDVQRLLLMGHYEQTFAQPSRHGHSLKELIFIQGDCIFLKDGKCSVYENRPTACRIFPYTITDDGEGFDHDCPHCGAFSDDQSFISNGKDGIKRIINDIETTMSKHKSREEEKKKAAKRS